MVCMDNKELMQKTRQYLNNYLDAFVSAGQEEDVHFFDDFGIEVSPHEFRHNFGVKPVDLQKTSFEHFFNTLPRINQRDIINTVSAIPNALVAVIGALDSSEFGLWVAKENPSSKIIIYNGLVEPQTGLENFPPYLFNEINPHTLVKMQRMVPYDKKDIQGSFNKLFRANGFRNVELRAQMVDEFVLEDLVCEAKRRPLVIYSERTPTIPNEMTYPIACCVRDHANAEMILMPLINSEINNYLDDEFIQFMGNHHEKFKPSKENPVYAKHQNQSARTRVYTSIHMHYALKIAEIGGGKLYAQDEFSSKPPITVSTIEIKK